jgi:hypothetical protein
MAGWGLVLPYAVVLALGAFLASVVGHSGYTASPHELDGYRRTLFAATWAGLALSWALSLPYLVSSTRAQFAATAGAAPKLAVVLRRSAVFLAITAANAAAVLLLMAVVWP